MRLKSVKILGFKSFADVQILEPKFPAITAVVGPNGCGKSNVVDAIKWVIGESSARQLRGEQMTDVIFNGSSTRKPVGQAHVELTFENNNPSEHSPFSQYAEISIKRLISREGHSAYYLNNTRCRRRDILDLLSGTGLGARSYAIIEQGMIHRFIEAKPEELRQFLEEAAGISRYYDRKKETLAHLDQTKEDLARAADLEKEIHARCIILKEQAEEAAAYQSLRQELMASRQEYLSLAYRQTSHELELKSQALATAQQEWKTYQESIADLKKDRLEKEYARDKLKEHFSTRTQEHNTLIQTQQQHDQQLTQLQTHINWLQDRIAQITQESQAKKEAKEILLAEIAQQTDSQWEALLEPYQQTDWKQNFAQEELSLKNNIAAAEKNRQNINQTYHQKIRDRDLLASNCEHHRHRIASKKDRIRGLDLEVESLMKKIDALDTQTALAIFASKETQYAECLQTHQELGAAVDRVRQEHLEQSTLYAQTSQHVQDLSKRMQKFESECSALQNMRASWVTQLDRDAKLVNSKTFTNHSYQDRLLYSSPTQFLYMGQKPVTIEMLEKEAELDLEYVWGDQEPSYWSSLIAHDSPQTVLNDLDRLQPNQAYVLPNGVLVGANWIRPLRKKAPRLAEVTAQYDLAKAEYEAMQKTLTEQKEVINTLLQRKQRLETQLRDSAAQKEKVQAEMHQANLALQKMQQLAGHFQEHSKRLANERQVHETQLSEMHSQLEEMMQQYNTLAEQCDGFTQSQQDSDRAVKDAAEAFEKWRTARDLFVAQYNQILQDKQIADMENKHRQTRLNDLDRELTHSVDMIKSLTQQLEEKAKEINILQEMKTGLEPCRLESEKILSELMREMKNATEIAQLAIDRMHESELRGQEYMGTVYAREAERDKFCSQCEALKEQIEEQGWFVEQICQIETQEPLNTLKNKWTTLDKKFKEFGPVNLKALTEYQTESARAELLKTQREDLESASVALQHAMQLLEQEIQTLFDETYVKLRQEFAATFPLLFQGGSATLTLEPDLVTGKPGLIVHAQPPGKKNTRLSVLSGGEKALTAAALVFAFFQLNPAPFCILDEIDAPLDDPNTFRLGTMLESLKDRVQFIVVTHSKVMMQFADQLYGVTMKEPGVSRFVAVNKSSLETSAVQ